MTNFYDQEQVLHTYYPEVERLVREVTGARKVLAFDYNVRKRVKSRAPQNRSVSACPLCARRLHTEVSTATSARPAPRTRGGQSRSRDGMRSSTYGDRSQDQCRTRHWRPGRAVSRATDLVATDLLYTDRTGEIYNVTFNPAHRWYYFRHMEASEVMVFANFDSLDHKIVPHSAFYDPTAAADAPPRESIEVRTIAFF